jgi:hypothetical protein
VNHPRVPARGGPVGRLLRGPMACRELARTPGDESRASLGPCSTTALTQQEADEEFRSRAWARRSDEIYHEPRVVKTPMPEGTMSAPELRWVAGPFLPAVRVSGTGRLFIGPVAGPDRRGMNRLTFDNSSWRVRRGHGGLEVGFGGGRLAGDDPGLRPKGEVTGPSPCPRRWWPGRAGVSRRSGDLRLPWGPGSVDALLLGGALADSQRSTRRAASTTIYFLARSRGGDGRAGAG